MKYSLHNLIALYLMFTIITQRPSLLKFWGLESKFRMARVSEQCDVICLKTNVSLELKVTQISCDNPLI